MSVKSFFAAMTLKVKVIVICSAVAVTSAAAVAVGVAVTKEDTYRVLKVFEMTGSSIVERSSSGELEAYVGMNLESGDTLTVGDDSTLRILLDNDKYVLLDSGTILELVATGTASDSRTAINLKNGTILNEITNPLSANSSYEVSTPKATMAVRGTSFTVSVEEDASGGFTIREDTFNGKVEVILLDAKGDPKDEKALVTADKGVTIRTEPDKESGNPAEIDGNSRFVYEDEKGGISELGEGDDPIRDIRYDMISATVKNKALRSNDESLMILDEKIVAKLRGSSDVISETEAQITAPVSEPETTPAVTSVPETSVNTEEFTQTAEAFGDPLNENSRTETAAASEPSPETPTESSAALTEAAADTIAEVTVSIESEVPETSAPETAPEESENSETSAETEKSETTVTTASETEPVSSETSYTAHTGTSSSGSSGPSGSGGAGIENKLYKVEFICEGKLISSVYVKNGDRVAEIPQLDERNGYTVKWMWKDNEFTSGTEVHSDMIVTAVYTINTCTVTFTSEADTSYKKTVTADYGTALADILPEIPEIKGYTGVWKIGGTVLVSGGYKVTDDVAVKAVYTINTYTVTFKAEGSADITRTVEHGNTITDIPELPEKTGYTAKWISGGAEFTSETQVTSDMTVTAEYTIISYNITLTSSADPAYSKVISADHGTLLANVLPAVPDVTGYTGVWKIDGTTAVSGSYKVTGDIAVKAVYTINTYTVTFTADADTPYSHEETADHGTLLADILPDMPTKTGHDGVWTIGGATIDADYIIEGNTNVVADYTPKTYTVKFLNADGSLYDTREAEYNTAVTDIPEIQKDGYIIKWIYNGSEFTSDVKITDNIEVTAEETEAVTLTFQFAEPATPSERYKSYIIPKGTSFEDNGLTMPEPDADEYFSATGWETGTHEEVDETTEFIESLILYPKQEAITYRVDFYNTDGTFIGSSYPTYSDYISTFGNMVCTDNGIDEPDYWLVYSKDGSSSRAVGEYEDVASLIREFGFDETSTIKVVAVIEVSTLTWYDENGTSHTETVRKSGNLLETLNSLRTLPTGCYWAGSDKVTPIDSSLTCTNDMTVYAAITVKFAYNSLPSKTVNLPLGGCLNDVGESLPNDGAADYHTLIWSNNGTEVNETTKFYEPVTLTSTETEIQYTISFEFKGNTSDPTIDTSGIFSETVMDLYFAKGGYDYEGNGYDVMIDFNYGSGSIVIDSSTKVKELADELAEGQTRINIRVYVF